MVSSKNHVKYLALAIAVIALLQNCVFAYSGETNELSKFGSFRDGVLPQDLKNPTVIHIQDIHMNLEAQANIACAISEIASNRADLIALEGAFGPLEFKKFSTYPYPEAIHSVAFSMLKQLSISGAVYAAMTNNRLAPVVGVDDERLYLQNIDAYKRASLSMADNAAKLRRVESSLQIEQERVYGPELLSFDRLVCRYRANKISFVDYVTAVRERLSPEDAPRFPEVIKLARAIRLESIIDLQTIREASLSNPTAAEAVLRTLVTAKNINGDLFYEELNEAELRLYQTLAVNAEEKALATLSRRIELLGKLIKFELSPAEWNEYRAGRVAAEPKLFTGLVDYEDFYFSAEARNNAIAEKLLKEMSRRGAKTAVLVAGGFHAPGIRERILKAGVSYVSFVPRVTHINGLRGNEYLSVFNREKSPLEQLFPSLRISVSPPVWTGSLQTQAATAIIDTEIQAGRKQTALEWFKPLILMAGSGALWAVSFFHRTLMVVISPAVGLGILLVHSRPMLIVTVLLALPALAAGIEPQANSHIGQSVDWFKGLILASPILVLLSFCFATALKNHSNGGNGRTIVEPFPRFVSGYHWKPQLSIREREFSKSNILIQLAALRNPTITDPKEFGKKIIQESMKRNILLEMRTPVRAIDGPGSALDIPEYQRMLKHPTSHTVADTASTITMAATQICRMKFELIPKAEIMHPTENRKIEVEYVSTKYGTSRFCGPVDLNSKGETRNGFTDAVGYIFVNLFGLGGGIRIIDETNVPGGMESSSIMIKTLVEAASMLSGVRLSKADIWILSTALENDVFKGVTGGQGPLAADMGGVYQHLWFLSNDDERSAFSIELVPKQKWKILQQHMLLAHAGNIMKSGRTTIGRSGPLINKMWLDLLKHRDPVTWDKYLRMIPLATEYAEALRRLDIETVARTVNELVDIRDFILRRWMSLMLNAKYHHRYDSDYWTFRKLPNYAYAFASRVNEESHFPDYGPIRSMLNIFMDRGWRFLRKLSLYSFDPVNEVIAKARENGMAGMPAGAGGPNASIGLISPKGVDHLQSFVDTSHRGLERIFPLRPFDAVQDEIDWGGEPSRYMPFEIGGPTQAIGFGDLKDIGVELAAMPESRFYDQETGDIVDKEEKERREKDLIPQNNGGRWPVLLPIYEAIGNWMIVRGHLFSGIFISKVALPLLIESGVFVIGASAVFASIFNLTIGLNDEFTAVFIVAKVIWFLLDQTGDRDRRNNDSFFILWTTLAAYFIGFGLFDKMLAPLALLSIVALAPHLAVNIARLRAPRKKVAGSMFQSPSDPVKMSGDNKKPSASTIEGKFILKYRLRKIAV